MQLIVDLIGAIVFISFFVVILFADVDKKL